MPKFKKGNYYISVKNAEEDLVDEKVNFTLTSYGKEKQMALSDYEQEVDAELKSALKESKAVKKDNEEKKQTEVVYYDEIAKKLTIQVNKDKKRDCEIVAQFFTKEGTFPWKSIQSNVDWKEDVKGSIQQLYLDKEPTSHKYYQATFKCPKQHMSCTFEIPHIKEYIKTEIF